MYSEEKLQELYQLSQEYYAKCIELQEQMMMICERLTQDAKEHAIYGIARRLLTLRECMRFFFDKVPPDQDAEPEIEIRAQANASLHAFLINCCGIGDNIAWLLAYERGLGDEQQLEKQKHKIGLFKESFSSQLTIRVRAKASQFKRWHKFIVGQRHPTAHRIPPYIIPYIQSTTTGTNDYTPYYIHSFDKSRPVPLHAQVLCDLGAVIELVDALVKDLNEKYAQQSR